MFEGFGGGGSAFDIKKEDNNTGFGSIFGGGNKDDDSLTSKYSKSDTPSAGTTGSSFSTPFGTKMSSNTPFDRDEGPPIGSSNPHSNDKGTSRHADLNAREANYGNLSVLDKMRGMQSNRLNMDGDVTLAEQYADKSLDRRFGDGRHNVTMTDVYTDEHLYRAVKGLNTDGFIEEPAENALDIEGNMNYTDYKKNEDFDPFGTRSVTESVSDGYQEMKEEGIVGDYSKESTLGQGGIKIIREENSNMPEGVVVGEGGTSGIKEAVVATSMAEKYEKFDEVPMGKEAHVGSSGESANMRSEQPNMKSGQPNMKAGGPDMRSGTPDMRSGTPDMRSGTPDMRSGTPSMKPDMDSGYTAGKNLPANLKNIKKADFYRLIKFDSRGNPIGPDGQPLQLSPGEKAALLKLKKKFEEEDSKPVEKKKKIDPLEELKQQTAERERVRAEMEGEELGDMDAGSSSGVDFDVAGVSAGGATVVNSKNKDSGQGGLNNNKKRKKIRSEKDALSLMDQKIDPNSIFDEDEVFEAKEYGVSLKELRDYKQGKIEKPIKMMTFKEIQGKIEELKNRLSELEVEEDKHIVETRIELLEGELIQKLTGLM